MDFLLQPNLSRNCDSDTQETERTAKRVTATQFGAGAKRNMAIQVSRQKEGSVMRAEQCIL
jgi:hypothetical protein